MMQQFINRYESEVEKQDCLKAVDVSRTVMRKKGKRSNKMTKSSLNEALNDLSMMKDKSLT